MFDLIAQYTNLSPYEVERLLSLSPQNLYADAVYQSLVAQLDKHALHKTLTEARHTYDKNIERIKDAHGVGSTLMSGHTLSTWLVAFLMYPDRMPEMLEKHALVPMPTIQTVLPELLEVLAELPPQVRGEWQRALVILTLPLLAHP